MATTEHIPVMVSEVLKAIEPKRGGFYVDCTYGRGGHTRAVLDSTLCRVLAIDRDPEACAHGFRLMQKYESRLTVVCDRFSRLTQIFATHGLYTTNGIVFDLGVTSPQLSNSVRGFSFQCDGPLDMRMGTDSRSAREIVNQCKEDELARLFCAYGEEKKSRARRIAKAIVERRKHDPITTTFELLECVMPVLDKKRGKHHPATRLFQALRIAVNEELQELQEALDQCPPLLAPGGTIAAISFHSLEDRIVKHVFTSWTSSPGSNRYLPTHGEAKPSPFVFTVRGVAPSHEEIKKNPRARSARLRAVRRRL